MSRVLPLAMLLAALAWPSAALSETTTVPVLGCAGHLVVNLADGSSRWIEEPLALTTVYDNLEAPPIFGVASSDLMAVWGDQVVTTDVGVLQEFSMTILNASLDGAFLFTPQIAFTFRRSTMEQLITFHVLVNLPGGLAPGFYAVVTIQNLGIPPFVLPQTDLCVQQQIEAGHGLATRLGVVSLSPPAIGASHPSMYCSDGPGSSPPGFYEFASGPADPGYRIAVEPVDAAGRASWGSLKRRYR